MNMNYDQNAAGVEHAPIQGEDHEEDSHEVPEEEDDEEEDYDMKFPKEYHNKDP